MAIASAANSRLFYVDLRVKSPETKTCMQPVSASLMHDKGRLGVDGLFVILEKR
jgi:hypothetical protein